jgi:mannosyltransferase OCH1-like enzyme
MDELEFIDLDRYLCNQKGHIIHQVWFGNIPNKRVAKKEYEKMKLYRNSWKIKNPKWCHIEWSKPMCLHLLNTFFIEHTEMFKNYKHEIQRCDIIRYMILHRYGGIYADMDYYCNRPFDEVLERFNGSIYFVQTPNTTILQNTDHISNSLMYSVPQHPFWKQLLLEMQIKQHTPYYYTKHIEVMFTTGPGILNRVYEKYKHKYKVKSYPAKLFHPYGIGDDKSRLTANPEVYAIHIGKGSWESKDSKFFILILKEWKIILFIILTLFSSLLFRNRV